MDAWVDVGHDVVATDVVDVDVDVVDVDVDVEVVVYTRNGVYIVEFHGPCVWLQLFMLVEALVAYTVEELSNPPELCPP